MFAAQWLAQSAPRPAILELVVNYFWYDNDPMRIKENLARDDVSLETYIKGDFFFTTVPTTENFHYWGQFF